MPPTPPPPIGFARLTPEQRRHVASLGGKANFNRHRYTPEEARVAGSKGGKVVSQDREHMREIAAKGGRAKRGVGTK